MLIILLTAGLSKNTTVLNFQKKFWKGCNYLVSQTFCPFVFKYHIFSSMPKVILLPWLLFPLLFKTLFCINIPKYCAWFLLLIYWWLLLLFLSLPFNLCFLVLKLWHVKNYLNLYLITCKILIPWLSPHIWLVHLQRTIILIK